jgi:hypothetical protein
MQPEPAPSGSTGAGDAVVPPQTTVGGAPKSPSVDGAGAQPTSDGLAVGDRSAERLSSSPGDGPSPLVIGSVVLLAVGVALMLLRRLARASRGPRTG